MSAKRKQPKKRAPAAPAGEAPTNGDLPAELEVEFEIVRQLGRGATAVVHLARERALDREIALKIMRPGFADDEESAARLEREARTLARLRHPKIVAIYGTRRLQDGRIALLMQHVPGRTLRAELRRRGALPVSDFERYLRDVLEALAHSHRQRIVHRDVKPENIYLDDESGFAMLSDFGIARPWDTEFGLTISGAALGTPAYMAPEQIDGGDVDGRADLYAVGMLAYEMLAGRHPWAGETLYAILYSQKHEDPPPLASQRPDLPQRLLGVVDGLLRKDPADRWTSAEAVLDALDARPGLEPAPPSPRWQRGGGPSIGPARAAYVEQAASGPAAAPSVEAVLEVLRNVEASDRTPANVDAGDRAPGDVEAGDRAPGDVDASDRAPGDVEAGDRTPGDVEEPSRLYAPDAAGPASPPGLAASPAMGRSRWSARRSRLAITLAGGVAAIVLGAGAARLALGGAGGEREQAPEHTAAAAAERAAATPIDLLPPGPPREPASILALSGGQQEGPSGEPLAEPLTVVVHDAEGDPVADLEVEFRILIGDGRMEPESSHTDEEGRASTVWVLGAAGDSSVAVASVAGAPELLARFAGRVVAGPPARVELEGAGQRGAPGELLGSPIDLRVVDRTGRAVTGATVRLEAESGGRVEPRDAVTDSEGQVRVRWRLGPGPGEQRLRADVAELPEPVTITARADLPPLPTRSGLALGGTHTCRLDANGTASCWGGNTDGQLGSGGGRSGSAAVRVDAGAPLAMLAAGVSHTCALDNQGQILCWGANDAAQLGDGTRTRRPEPVSSARSGRFVAIAAGVAHTCALDSSAHAYCWGENRRGQLGDGTRTEHTRPSPVAGGREFHALTAGWFHTCALDTGRSAVCWGANDSGQLGSGTAGGDRPAPTAVAGGQRFTAIVAGSGHTCGITRDGAAHCWGDNSHGQVGDGTTISRAAPVRVRAPHPFASIVAGAAHTCGLTGAGDAYCWGRNNFGQLGTGTGADARRPTPVAGGLRFRSLFASGAHTCGATTDGERYCWGYNLDGQLGDGSRVHRNRPVRVVVQ